MCLKNEKKNNKYKRAHYAEQMFLSPFDFSTVISLSIWPVRIARLILLQLRSSIASSDHRHQLPVSDLMPENDVDGPIARITT